MQPRPCACALCAGFNLPQVQALYAPLLAEQPTGGVRVHEDQRYGAHDDKTRQASLARVPG